MIKREKGEGMPGGGRRRGRGEGRLTSGQAMAVKNSSIFTGP